MRWALFFLSRAALVSSNSGAGYAEYPHWRRNIESGPEEREDMRVISWRRLALGGLGIASALTAGCMGGDGAPEGKSDAKALVSSEDIQIISVSDWHGQLDPLST